MGVKLLYVCLGNICRSAAADGISVALLQREFKGLDLEIDSAGTYGGHTGSLPDPRMRSAAAKRGYDLTSRSRKICVEDLDKFDMIVVMDQDNFANVNSLTTTQEQRNKIFKMVDYCRKFDIDYVPDPYYMGEDGFEYVLDILEDSCRNLLSKIACKDSKKKVYLQD